MDDKIPGTELYYGRLIRHHLYWVEPKFNGRPRSSYYRELKTWGLKSEKGIVFVTSGRMDAEHAAWIAYRDGGAVSVTITDEYGNVKNYPCH